MTAQPRILEAHEVGPSTHGSTRLKAMARCMQLYAWRTYMHLGKGSGNYALLLGSAVHYIAAHHYLRVQCRQRGEDPGRWEEPMAALNRAMALGILDPMPPEEIARARDIYIASFNPNQSRGPEVLHVEVVLPLEFGALDCPGHPKHGTPIIYDSRLDLITRGSDKKVYFTDIKTGANVTATTIRGYKLDWQFIMMHLIGRVYYGAEFGGVMLFKVGTTAPYPSEIIPIPFSEALLESAADRYVELNTRAAQLELLTSQGTLSAHRWPAALTELTCVHRYGECEGYNLCRGGSPMGKRKATRAM